VLKTEQINSQQNPALPDFVGKNTARGEIDYRMPEVDDASGGRKFCGGLDENQHCYLQV